MFKKNLKLSFFIVLASIICFGCGGAAESNQSKNSNGNQKPAALNTNVNSSSTPAALSNANSPVSNNPMANINKNAQNRPAMPTPKIGSGGDDLGLFTQVRGAFSSDPDLIGVIIDVKEGNATLSGKVASEDKKKKAEQLAKNVSGIKSVKNNISVSK